MDVFIMKSRFPIHDVEYIFGNSPVFDGHMSIVTSAVGQTVSQCFRESDIYERPYEDV